MTVDPVMTDVVVVDQPASIIVVTEPDGDKTIVVSEQVVSVVSLLVPGPPGSVGATGPQGIDGPPGLDGGTFTYTQMVPAAVWTITHNLGYPPNVQVINTLGEVVWGEINHTSVNQVVLTYTAAFSGVAYLS